MSDNEKYGTRDLTYSQWHRFRSIGRFVGGDEQGRRMSMIDIDCCEYDASNDVVVLVETARDNGQENPFKQCKVTQQLAKRLGCPAFVVLYTPSSEANPCAPDWKDISRFRVRQISPQEDRFWTILSPKEWALMLQNVREKESLRLDNEFMKKLGHE